MIASFSWFYTRLIQSVVEVYSPEMTLNDRHALCLDIKQTRDTRLQPYGVGIISGTAERNDCVSFRILQEYGNLRNGTAERTVIGRNGTLILSGVYPYLLMAQLSHGQFFGGTTKTLE